MFFSRGGSLNLNQDGDLWFKHEKLLKHKVLRQFWDERIVKYNKQSVNQFKNWLITFHFPPDLSWQERIDQIFTLAGSNAIQFDEFYAALENIPFAYFEGMAEIENLPIVSEVNLPEYESVVSNDDIENLRQYFVQKEITASITLGSSFDGLVTPCFPENLSQAAFAMHSVGKVFTGMLAVIRVSNGTIPESDLNEPIKLDQSILDVLPASVKEQLKKVTLHQVMTHKAGLGDYFKQYGDAILSGNIPDIKSINDFLPFIEDKVFPIGETRYSNAGILLLGFAIQYAYVKKYGPITYDDVLHKHILEPAMLPSFSPLKPDNGRFNAEDKMAPHIVGSPAGGYWITSEDLGKFGLWIRKECFFDKRLKSMLAKYGQEFYDSDREVVSHSGGIQSSTAYLYVSLKTGGVLAVLSDQPCMAFDLRLAVQREIFGRKPVKMLNGQDGGQPSKMIRDYYARMRPQYGTASMTIDTVDSDIATQQYHI